VRREALTTAGFSAAALILWAVAAQYRPGSATPAILSDQGELFYPKFADPQAATTVEVLDYDEATATARPLKVELRRGRWIISSHNDYPVDAAERLVKTAAALVDLKKDAVASDSAEEHGNFGVIDPLDQNVATLTGRGKRVTLRDAHREVLADYIFGRPVEGKPGFRYLRVPGQKRTYVVKTDADPSARLADWLSGGVLQISAATVRKLTLVNYSIDETMGRILNNEVTTLTQSSGRWRAAEGEKVNEAAVRSIAATLSGLRVVDVRPKPPSLAADLRAGTIQLTLEGVMALRQRGYFVTPTGRLLANQGEMLVETADGLVYNLRFGEVAASGPEAMSAGKASENRHLFVTVRFDPAKAAQYGGDAERGQRLAKALNDKFAGWFYIINSGDFRNLQRKRSELVSASGAPAVDAPPPAPAEQ